MLSLQAPPSKPALGSLSERSNNVAEMPVEEGPENRLVCQHMINWLHAFSVCDILCFSFWNHICLLICNCLICKWVFLHREIRVSSLQLLMV